MEAGLDLPLPPHIFHALESLGRSFQDPSAWVLLGGGVMAGYALGRVARATVPWIALFYLAAALTGNANPEALVKAVEGVAHQAWAFLSGAPVGLSLGLVVGGLSGLGGRE